MKKVEKNNAEPWSDVDFEPLNELLNLWLKVVKKMEFYRLEADFKKLTFEEYGLYRLYDFGNLQSIFLLSEIEKFRTSDEGSTLSDLKMEEGASIFRDVSLKIGKHVLLELKREMYLPGKELMQKILKVYSFRYDNNLSFHQNYQNALKDKQITSSKSREATIIMFTLKIVQQLKSIKGICYYLGYIKSILLDRSSGMLAAEYDLWTLLYETCLRLYGRHPECREQ